MRSGPSAMELILHPIPIDAVGAHAGPVLTGKQVAALTPRRRATKAGADAAAHRRLEGDLDRRQWNRVTLGQADHRLEHRRRAAGEEINAPTLALPAPTTLKSNPTGPVAGSDQAAL